MDGYGDKVGGGGMEGMSLCLNEAPGSWRC